MRKRLNILYGISTVIGAFAFLGQILDWIILKEEKEEMDDRIEAIDKKMDRLETVLSEVKELE